MYHKLTLLSAILVGAVFAEELVLVRLNTDAGKGEKPIGIIRPNISVISTARKVFAPKGKSLKFGDSPILKLSFQPRKSKLLPFSEAKSSQFYHLSTADGATTESPTSVTPYTAIMRSVHRISNTTYQMPADFLCEGLTCPKGTQCTLAQPVCTAQDCSLKPSCTKKLSEDCEKCRPPCVHAVLNIGATGGCHPCLCEVTVFRPPPQLTKQFKQIQGN